MALTPFLGQDLTAYRIDNTVYSITYRHGIRQQKPFHKNPLSQRLTGQLLTGDPEQVQRLAPAFSQSMGNFIAQGVQPFAPMVRPWDFQEPETTVNRGFPDHIEKKDSRHLRVAAFLCRKTTEVRPGPSGLSEVRLAGISRTDLLPI